MLKRQNIIIIIRSTITRSITIITITQRMRRKKKKLKSDELLGKKQKNVFKF